jgi:hypothetical protein
MDRLVKEDLAVREAAGIFDDAKSFEKALDELTGSGFDHADISLLASQSAVEAKLGHRYERTSDLADREGVPRISLVPKSAVGNAQGTLIGGLVYIGALAAAGPIIVAGGSIAAAIGAAVAAGGAGGLLGGFLGKLVGDKHSGLMEEQLQHGGLILWVSLKDPEHEEKAVAILKRNGAKEVDVHTLKVVPPRVPESVLP